MAVIALSVTGAAFCESAKSANELLMRHNLDGFVVDVFAGTVLNFFAFAIMTDESNCLCHCFNHCIEWDGIIFHVTRFKNQ